MFRMHILTSIYKCVQVTSSQPRFSIFAYIYQQVHTNLCKQLHSGLNNQFLHAYIYKYIQVCASDSILAFISNSCMQMFTSSYKCVQATSIWPKLPISACIYLQAHTKVCKRLLSCLNYYVLHSFIEKSKTIEYQTPGPAFGIQDLSGLTTLVFAGFLLGFGICLLVCLVWVWCACFFACCRYRVCYFLGFNAGDREHGGPGLGG